jgi:hypothetical protein
MNSGRRRDRQARMCDDRTETAPDALSPLSGWAPATGDGQARARPVKTGEGISMNYVYKTIESPVGKLKLVASDKGLAAILRAACG